MWRSQAIVSESADLEAQLAESRASYLASITDGATHQEIEKRLTRLARRVGDLATKERGSTRSFRLAGPIQK